MRYTAEQLYRLLPAFYRVRDAEEGEPLKALLEVIAKQVGVIEDDITRLYSNWFIETCDEWVVPYIGELLGIKGLHPPRGTAYSTRAFVANTIRYRRRKGTITMLEQLARDITGWNARAVEFFKLLDTNQDINHLRLDNLRTPDLRQVNPLELLDTPFDTIAHTVDVRHISSRRGKHNIPNIGIFLWRLQAFPVYRAAAYPHKDKNSKEPNGCFSFSPLGNDIPLFNHPETEAEITHLAEEINVPTPIRRLVFLKNKDSYYDESPDLHKKSRSIYIWVNGKGIPSDSIIPCNLEDWTYRPADKKKDKILVDPLLGRIAFHNSKIPGIKKVEVKYYYGFSSEVGGGCYKRDFKLSREGVEIYKIGGKDPDFNTIKAAYESWMPDEDRHPEKNALLLIDDSRIYHQSLPKFVIPAGKTLEIRAGDGEFPLLKVKGSFSVEGGTGTKLILDGLRICSHPLIIKNGNLASLEINHCTLVPGLDIDVDSKPISGDQASLKAEKGNIDLCVSIKGSICGGIELLDIHNLEIRESIIQGLDKNAIAGPGSKPEKGPNLVVTGSTVMGEVLVRQVELVSNTIFTGPVRAQLKQKGCVRFCFIPGGSHLPRRFRCQPDLAIEKAIEAASKENPDLSEEEKAQIIKDIRVWLKPVFTDEDYGKPGYAQLSMVTPKEIREGAEDGSEMGVFQHLHQPHREANLRASLEEYLPANMEAGIFFIN